MKKLVICLLAGMLAIGPILAVGVSQTPIPPFSGTGATAVGASAAIDVSNQKNAAVQIWSTDAPGATIVNVELRSTSTAPWYIAAQCTAVPVSGTTTSVCYFTLPLAKDMRIEIPAGGYVSGHILAIYNERNF